jgi:hypothetical protein
VSRAVDQLASAAGVEGFQLGSTLSAEKIRGERWGALVAVSVDAPRVLATHANPRTVMA